MEVLGISAFYHDSAAALVRDGDIVAAAQEERFSRLKHDRRFPRSAIAYCLDEAGTNLESLDRVVYYESPKLKTRRQIGTVLAAAPHGYKQFSEMIRSWCDRRKTPPRQLIGGLTADAPSVDWESRIVFSEHHLSHAAAAFYPSPFDEAAILTIDAVGEWATTSFAVGDGNALEILGEIHFPHSLGMLYSAFTHYLGFRVNAGEYKLMGLAPYGSPRHVETIFDKLIDVKADGSFRLDMAYFHFIRGLTMTNDRFHTLFGGLPRSAEAPIEKRHMDVAASIQAVTELVLVRLARSLRAQAGKSRLCLAGGVALNCVANRAIRRTGVFDDIWIQPAAGDAGSAIGAALWGYYAAGNGRAPRTAGDQMKGALLGPAYGQADVERRLRDCGAVFVVCADETVVDTAAAALENGLVVGWFQGRMEFGPRALGSRSILADARRPNMQRTLNLKVRYREGFRPFAPAVLAEHASEWFELENTSPYMLFVADVAESHRLPVPADEHQLPGFERLLVARSHIPAATHVDGSARVQTVTVEDNPRFHSLISRFFERTGCPIILNTSFNVRDEPIVCTPEDAFRCFMGTGIDLLVVENCVLTKDQQDPHLVSDDRIGFALA